MFTMEMEPTARAIAYVAHVGQTDKAGEPYIHHPERVASFFDPKSYELRTIAWLHDVVEDSSVSLETLAEIGFEKHTLEAIRCITHLPNEPRAEYYARVKQNNYARQVKIADIADNLNEFRLGRLDPKEAMRLRVKYAEALEALSTKAGEL